jgi:hypothetical protein
VSVSSGLHGRPIADDPTLLDQLRLELQREFPATPIVKDAGDTQIIFVLLDYVPGCLPNCDRF